MGAHMKVVILAGSTDEAHAYAKGAGLNRADVIIPRTEQALRGLELAEGDLVAEFASWYDLPDGRRRLIRNALYRCFVGTGPRWEKIRGNRDADD